MAEAPFFAIAAEFGSGDELLEAVRTARSRGFRRLHAYSPVPVPGVAALLGEDGRWVRLAGVVGAVVGGLGFFGMAAYATTVDYVFLIGGRPTLSWQYFVIPSVSIAAVGGGLAASVAMLFLSRLPRLNHPAFNIAGFERATDDRFFLTIEPDEEDPHFDAHAVERFLRREGPKPIRVEHVPR